VSYIGKLSKEEQQALGAKSSLSRKKRSPEVLKEGIHRWVHKKFLSPTKKQMRDKCWKNIDWQYKLVHGRVMEQTELDLMKAHGIELISFDTVLEKLSGGEPGELFGGAGTDIAEIVRYYASANRVHLTLAGRGLKAGGRRYDPRAMIAPRPRLTVY